ncbi:MAG: response regulator [Planctomycetia bacterium]|nr:response regulator [Planctomycetia bacterium]
MPGRHVGMNPPSGTLINLLLVESDPASVGEIRTRLSESGDRSLRLDVASSIAEALEKVSAGGVGALLLSLELPDLSGPAAIAHIRSRAPLVPILILVRPEDSALGGDFLRAGAQDYVVRGLINATFLVRRIRSAIERKRIEEEGRLLTAVSLAVGQGEDFDRVLQRSLREICLYCGWDYGQAWLPDAAGDGLLPGPFWARDDAALAFRAASQGGQPAAAADLPSTALREQGLIHCEDLAGDARFLRAGAAARAGFRSGVFIPVPAGSRIVAVIEFFMRRPRQDDTRLFTIVNAIAAQFGQSLLRRKAEDDLHRSERHFRKIVENVYNGYIIQEGGVIRELSDGTAAVFGYTASELAGRPILGLVAPEFREDVKRRYESGYEGAYEIVGLRKDGSRFHAEVVGFDHRWSGRPARLGAVRDVSARRSAEERLARLNDCFLSFGPDPAGNIDRLVALCGQAMNALWAVYCVEGKAGLDLAGQWQVPEGLASAGGPLTAFATQVLGSARTETIFTGGRGVVRHGETNPSILRGPAATYAGRVVWITGEARGSLVVGLPGDADPRREDSRYMGIVASAIGVEEERRLERDKLRAMEEQMRQTTKMEAIGRLAGGVAHDFNNLLTAIVGYAELARDRFGEDDPARREMDEILKAGERASGLTRQLLAFSRRQVLQPQVLDLNAVVADMEKLLRRLIGESIRLEISLAPDTGPVKADRGQLEQVVVNLAVNARDAMGGKGTLTLATRRVEAVEVAPAPGMQSLRPQAFARLSVTDTGVGMTEEVISHMFEPFFTTKDRGKGTGLGLATVYGIVRQSGGHIQVRSAPGAGTTFEIDLPCTEVAGAAVPAQEQPHPSPKGPETILVVEDEDALRALVVRALRGLGYTVLEAGDGPSAVRAAAGHPGEIHLLVSDVVMPGPSGPETAREIALHRPSMRILFISGYADDALGKHSIVPQGASFLAKPFSPRNLAVKVREVLETRPV